MDEDDGGQGWPDARWKRLMEAVREAQAGLPVTQYTADTHEPITVTFIPRYGKTVLSANGRYLGHLTGERDPTRPQTQSVHASRLN